MIQHRFSIGDHVKVLPNGLNRNLRPGTYTIVRRMPVTNNTCQYRVKNALDDHERVLSEAELQAE